MPSLSTQYASHPSLHNDNPPSLIHFHNVPHAYYRMPEEDITA